MNKNLLVIDSSGRVTRSITRRLTGRFADAWRVHHPGGTVVQRDVGQNPPPPVNEPWIAAAFADAAQRTPAMLAALSMSEALIAEIEAADVVVVGTPLYNFGMPAQLKAYIDQIVRVGRTFAFEPDAGEPYRPLLTSKPVIAITAAGDGAVLAGGAMAHLNFLEPHLETVFGFIGLKDITHVRVGYDEFQDDRLRRSIAVAEAELDALAAGLAPVSATPPNGAPTSHHLSRQS